jgi:hypothetical protein
LVVRLACAPRARILFRPPTADRRPPTAVSILLATALILGFLPRGTSADPPVTGKPGYALGEWWQVADRRLRQTCAQWVVIEANPSGSLVESCGDHQVHRDFANDLGLVKVTRAAQDAVTFEPPLQELSFPLEVGKTWQQDYVGFTADDRVRWTASASWEISAYESVAVPAGSFDAYRIERTETWGPEMYGITVHAVSWWAPSVKAFVKRTHQDGLWESDLESHGGPPGP